MSLIFSLSSCKFLSSSASMQPIIVFTFDDQHASVYDVAFPIMQEYGYRGTNFVNSNALGQTGRFSWDELIEMELTYGWETGGHTLNHEALNQLDYEQAVYVIQQDYNNLEEHGLNPRSFALPKGQCPSQVYPFLRSLYKNIRGSSDFAMHEPLNRHALGYLAFQTGWTAQPVKQRILRGIANGERLIIIGFHRFNAESEGYMDSCSDDVFRDILRFVYDHELKVLPLAEAVSED
ncbi:MAG: polysaccharide deacetylase family protein [Candidatus Cloacimonetes bacterium]|nr:polysaccharide deacetylase family protein [Candidatus Cloacimonadota bacterium]MDD3097417.1 polysaccharide deacetylase family protein [Candidatus Cloacimonadota bacterium]MDD3578678.1 polysaccharide deacetylase family protein [Candidatus Cloacimonadota bacterium]